MTELVFGRVGSLSKMCNNLQPLDRLLAPPLFGTLFSLFIDIGVLKGGKYSAGTQL